MAPIGVEGVGVGVGEIVDVVVDDVVVLVEMELNGVEIGPGVLTTTTVTVAPTIGAAVELPPPGGEQFNPLLIQVYPVLQYRPFPQHTAPLGIHVPLHGSCVESQPPLPLSGGVQLSPLLVHVYPVAQ